MSKPASSSSSNLDYHASPEDITQLRNEARSASAGCCTCTFRKEGRFSSHGKIVQLAVDGRTPNGERGHDWPAEVFVASDGTAGTVTVNQRFRAENATGDTRSYPDTVALTDADVESRVAKIPPAIERAWNAKPYRLRITDAKCGERLFVVRFVIQAFMSGRQHYTLKFVNVAGMGERDDVRGVASGRSYILPSAFEGKFNFGDRRTATDGGAEELEPHEFGHMIGLRDEYHDDKFNRGGVKYQFPDGTSETALVNGELMGSMNVKRAVPARYCVTVAYAAIAVLEENGCRVTDCVIE